MALGYDFTSQTDTEVVAHLIHHYRVQGLGLLQALQTHWFGQVVAGLHIECLCGVLAVCGHKNQQRGVCLLL